jgi:serine/threonine protein kinase/Leucine-rich repeat (LRR) protein
MADPSTIWALKVEHGCLELKPENLANSEEYESLLSYLETCPEIFNLIIADFAGGFEEGGRKWTDIFSRVQALSNLASFAIVNVAMTSQALLELSRMLFAVVDPPDASKFEVLTHLNVGEIIKQHGLVTIPQERKLVLSELRLYNVWHSQDEVATEAAFAPFLIALAAHDSITSLTLFYNDIPYFIVLDVISVLRVLGRAKALSIGNNLLLKSNSPRPRSNGGMEETKSAQSSPLPLFWAATPFFESTLERLNLSFIGLTTAGLLSLLSHLKTHNKIRRLDLGYNPIDLCEEGVREHFQAISSLKALRVTETITNSKGDISWIFDESVMVSLEDLRMEKCFTKESAPLLKEAFRKLSRNHILKTLSLDNNKLDTYIIHELVVALSLNRTLENLSILDCIAVNPQVDTTMTPLYYLAFGLQNNFTLLDLRLFTSKFLADMDFLKNPKSQYIKWFLEGLVDRFLYAWMPSNSTLLSLFGEDVLADLHALIDSLSSSDELVKNKVKTALDTLQARLTLHAEMRRAKDPSESRLLGLPPLRIQSHERGHGSSATAYFFHPPEFQAKSSLPNGSNPRSSWVDKTAPVSAHKYRESTGFQVDLATISLDSWDSHADERLARPEAHSRRQSNLSSTGSVPASRLSVDPNALRLPFYSRLLNSFPCPQPHIGENVIRFSLAGLGLTHVPQNISLFGSQLIELDLRGNKIVYLPQELTKMTNLTSLQLAHNNLDSLPLSLRCLSKLQTLSLYRNPLRLIPWKIRCDLSNPFKSVNLIPKDHIEISCMLWDYLRQAEAHKNGTKESASSSSTAPSNSIPLRLHCRMMVFGDGAAAFMQGMQSQDRTGGRERSGSKTSKTDSATAANSRSTSSLTPPSSHISYFQTRHDPALWTSRTGQTGKTAPRANANATLLSQTQDVEWMCFAFQRELETVARLFMGPDIAYVLTFRLPSKWLHDTILETWLNLILQFSMKGKGNDDGQMPFIYVVVYLLSSQEDPNNIRKSISSMIDTIVGKDPLRINIHIVESRVASRVSFVSEITQRVIATGMCLKRWHRALEHISGKIRELSHTPKPLYAAGTAALSPEPFQHPKQNILPMSSLVALIYHFGLYGSEIDKIVASLEENGTISYFDRYPAAGFASLLPGSPESIIASTDAVYSASKKSRSKPSIQDKRPKSMLSNLAVINLEYVYQLFSRLMLLESHAKEKTGIVDVSQAQKVWKDITAEHHRLLLKAAERMQKSPSGDSVLSIGSASSSKSNGSNEPPPSKTINQDVNHLIQASPTDSEVDMKTFWALLEETGLAIRLHSTPILGDHAERNGVLMNPNAENASCISMRRSQPSFSSRASSSSSLALQMSALDEESRAEYEAQSRRLYASIRSAGTSVGASISPALLATGPSLVGINALADLPHSISSAISDPVRQSLLSHIPEEDELSSSNMTPSPSVESIPSASPSDIKASEASVTRSRSKTMPSKPDSKPETAPTAVKLKSGAKDQKRNGTNDLGKANPKRERRNQGQEETAIEGEYYFVPSLLPAHPPSDWTPLKSWVPVPVAQLPETKPASRKMAITAQEALANPSATANSAAITFSAPSQMETSNQLPKATKTLSTKVEGRGRASSVAESPPRPSILPVPTHSYYQRVYTFQRMPFGLFEHLLLAMMSIPGISLLRLHHSDSSLLGAFEVRLNQEVGQISFLSPYRLFLDVAGVPNGTLLTHLEAQTLDTLHGWYPSNKLTHWIGYWMGANNFCYERKDLVLAHQIAKSNTSYRFPLRSISHLISETSQSPTSSLSYFQDQADVVPPWEGDYMDVELEEIIPDHLLAWTHVITPERFESYQQQEDKKTKRKSAKKHAATSTKSLGSGGFGVVRADVYEGIPVAIKLFKTREDFVGEVDKVRKSKKASLQLEAATGQSVVASSSSSGVNGILDQQGGNEAQNQLSVDVLEEWSCATRKGSNSARVPGLIVAMQELVHEVRILTLLGEHPNIVRLLGSIALPPQIVLERLSGGPLPLGRNKPSEKASSTEIPETNPWIRANLSISSSVSLRTSQTLSSDTAHPQSTSHAASDHSKQTTSNVVEQSLNASGAVGRPDLDAIMDFTCSLRALLDVAQGMSHMHARGVLHRDLFIYNVLRTDSQDPCNFQVPFAKLIDFGLARMVSARGETSAFKTERAWNIPPETRITMRFNAAGDVFAFATLLYQLYTQCLAHSVSEGEMVHGARSPLPPLPEYPISASNLSTIANTTHAQLVAHYARGAEFNAEAFTAKFNPSKRGQDPHAANYLRLKALELYEQLLHECWSHEPANRPSFGGTGEHCIVFKLTIIFILWTGVLP